MKIKDMLVPITCALLIGIGLGFYFFKEYNVETISIPVISSKETKTVSFLQVGVYSNIDNMNKALAGLEDYFYTIQEEKYHVYVAITSNSENVSKLAGYFKEKGYVTYIKDMTVSNSEFINDLTNYDELLKATNDLDAISVINSNILTSYKENIIDGNKN